MSETDPQSPPSGSPEAPLLLYEDGLPILDEVVDESSLDELATIIKAQLLAELEPRLQALARQALTESVKDIALQLKHAFEQQLDKALQERLQELVEQSVDKACKDAD